MEICKNLPTEMLKTTTQLDENVRFSLSSQKVRVHIPLRIFYIYYITRYRVTYTYVP